MHLVFLCAFCLGISKYNASVQKWMRHHRQELPWGVVNWWQPKHCSVIFTSWEGGGLRGSPTLLPKSSGFKNQAAGQPPGKAEMGRMLALRPDTRDNMKLICISYHSLRNPNNLCYLGTSNRIVSCICTLPGRDVFWSRTSTKEWKQGLPKQASFSFLPGHLPALPLHLACLFVCCKIQVKTNTTLRIINGQRGALSIKRERTGTQSLICPQSMLLSAKVLDFTRSLDLLTDAAFLLRSIAMQLGR